MEDRWNNLTNLLLTKNHIKITIEKRFFLSFLDSENDTENINKQKIISELDNDTVRPFFAVKLEFPSGTLRLWTGLQDISISSETYTGVGSFLGVSSFEEREVKNIKTILVYELFY